ncbi:unnamed protein product [Candida verbasci]|uniref:Ndc10 domain-containing protein n=1 Tax=Candida verbasci TaxID=1227364 RepID=A0A9W4XFS7_9ASCO|nr:unnamed protein product [Candida verbasci]
MSSDSEDSSTIDENIYQVSDLYKLYRPLWVAKSIDQSYLNKHKIFRTMCDFNITHGFLMKNLLKRKIKLKDLHATKIKNIDGLIITTTEENEQLYYGAVRNNLIEFCPISSIACYLFSRFHIADEHGAYEFNESNIINLLDEIYLLKGNNKLNAISYSQQHKSAINALSLSGLNYKDINLLKLLTTHTFEIKEKLQSNSPKNLPLNLIFKLSGFNSIEDYHIERDLIQPPEALTRKIFPFINNLDDSNQFKQLISLLRICLCQDMIIIKFKYPQNAISTHAIFNSEEFDEYIKEVQSNGKLNSIIQKNSVYSIIAEDTESEDSSGRRSSDRSSDNIANEKTQITSLNMKIIQLNEKLETLSKESLDLKNLLISFVEKQTDVFQKQSENFQIIQNSINGLIILISTNNKNSLPLIQQSLSETSNFISNQEQMNIKLGINNTIELLSKLNQEQHHQQAHHQFPHQLQPQSFYSKSPSMPILPPRSDSLSPENQSLNVSNIPLTPQQQERQRILNKRLSRQATTLFEMWDDFKNLEKELKDYDITVTEWLKVHGSSERQFRHTRLKIIKFIEEEAERRNCSVELIKERLHNKMRNRLRPWTLDEVQRMLTSGNKIDLDDTR